MTKGVNESRKDPERSAAAKKRAATNPPPNPWAKIKALEAELVLRPTQADLDDLHARLSMAQQRVGILQQFAGAFAQLVGALRNRSLFRPNTAAIKAADVKVTSIGHALNQHERRMEAMGHINGANYGQAANSAMPGGNVSSLAGLKSRD